MQRLVRPSPSAMAAGSRYVDYIDVVRVRTDRRYWNHPVLTKKLGKLSATATWQLSRWGNYFYLNVTQPTDACLELLEQINAELFHAEIARDYVDRSGELLQTFREHCIHRWKRKHSRQVKDTEYGSPRWAESNLVYYGKRSAKLDAYACHTEYRIRGVRALRRMGIRSVKDLRRFDYEEFWSNKLCLRKVSTVRLATSIGRDHRDVGTMLRQHYNKIGNLMISLRQHLPAGMKRNICFPRMKLQWRRKESRYELVWAGAYT
jgi:hypothetical protein